MQNNEYRGIFYTKRRSNAYDFSNCYSSRNQKPTNQQVKHHIKNWYHTNIRGQGYIQHIAANYRHFPTLKATTSKHNTSPKSLNHADQNRLLSFNLLYKSFNYFSLAAPSHEYIKVLTISAPTTKPQNHHSCQLPWQKPAKCRGSHAYAPYRHAKQPIA